MPPAKTSATNSARTITGSRPKYCANPPHTPPSTLSLLERVSRVCVVITSLLVSVIRSPGTFRGAYDAGRPPKVAPHRRPTTNDQRPFLPFNVRPSSFVIRQRLLQCPHGATTN